MNLSNSILSKFGAPTVGKTLPLVDNLLKKDYKNIVVLLLDGLGTCIMESNLKEDGFLRTHFIESISTVFPPTTVAATTSVMSGLQPIEHAWLGIFNSIEEAESIKGVHAGYTLEEMTIPLSIFDSTK